jgi:hypothetical protein
MVRVAARQPRASPVLPQAGCSRCAAATGRNTSRAPAPISGCSMCAAVIRGTNTANTFAMQALPHGGIFGALRTARLPLLSAYPPVCRCCSGGARAVHGRAVTAVRCPRPAHPNAQGHRHETGLAAAPGAWEALASKRSWRLGVLKETDSVRFVFGLRSCRSCTRGPRPSPPPAPLSPIRLSFPLRKRAGLACLSQSGREPAEPVRVGRAGPVRVGRAGPASDGPD